MAGSSDFQINETRYQWCVEAFSVLRHRLGIDIKLAIATEGKRINLPGGLPVIVDGHVIGGIGVGSGTGEQDKEVAKAAVAAFPGAKRY